MAVEIEPLLLMGGERRFWLVGDLGGCGVYGEGRWKSSVVISACQKVSRLASADATRMVRGAAKDPAACSKLPGISASPATAGTHVPSGPRYEPRVRSGFGVVCRCSMPVVRQPLYHHCARQGQYRLLYWVPA